MKASNRVVSAFVKIYVILVLGAATVLSPLSLSFIPLVALAWYLYNWRRPLSPVFTLFMEYFIFFALTLFLTRPFGHYFSVLFSLPVLVLITHSLENVSLSRKYSTTKYTRFPTPVFITLIAILAGVVLLALLLSSPSLLLASLAIATYFAILTLVVFRRVPPKPIEESRVDERILAGNTGHLEIEIKLLTATGGLLSIESAQDWVKVGPKLLQMQGKTLQVNLSFTPLLSGPSVISLDAMATDRWGLFQTRFELIPVNLFVIPRARYAAWLANRYLAASKTGSVPLISSIAALKPLYGLRRGIDYYGSQEYQAGDSLKNIDWKQSLKYNELISKEFSEFHGQTAVVLINLSSSNTEEADKLAYNIIVTAMTLAREGIPAALSAYDQENVKVSTQLLQPRELVFMSLQVAQNIVTYVNPVKYLDPPDVSRLRSNINRLGFGTSPAGKVLRGILQLEYRNLSAQAALHPATRALVEAFSKVDRQSSIVIISGRNHDAEALAFNTFSYTKKGYSVITV